MYVFNLHSKTDGLNNLFIMMFYIGGIFSVSTIIAGLQLKGKMKKERIKKITLISLPICVILMVLLSVIIFLSSSL